MIEINKKEIIILFICLFLIYIIYKYYKPKENFDNINTSKYYLTTEDIVNKVNNDNFMIDLEEVSKFDDNTQNNIIDNFNDDFFNFRSRLYNDSSYSDPVQKINSMEQGKLYKIGTKISDIYDDIAGTGDYRKK